MVASAALTLLVKTLVERTRPPTATMLGPVDSSYAFPSGHTLNATVFFGLVAALALTRVRSRLGRVAVVLAWLGASLAVGASRLYLGYHWLTDVLAGWSIAAVVLSLAAIGYWLLRARRLRATPDEDRAARVETA